MEGSKQQAHAANLIPSHVHKMATVVEVGTQGDQGSPPRHHHHHPTTISTWMQRAFWFVAITCDDLRSMFNFLFMACWSREYSQFVSQCLSLGFAMLTVTGLASLVPRASDRRADVFASCIWSAGEVQAWAEHGRQDFKGATAAAATAVRCG